MMVAKCKVTLCKFPASRWSYLYTLQGEDKAMATAGLVAASSNLCTLVESWSDRYLLMSKKVDFQITNLTSIIPHILQEFKK